MASSTRSGMAQSTATLPPYIRVWRIRSMLVDFKITLDTRDSLFHLSRTQSEWCSTCSPIRTPGTCGPTCTLLGPKLRGYQGMDHEWRQIVARDYTLYHTVVNDMSKHTLDATEDRVGKWEQIADLLRSSAMSVHEARIEACGWQDTEALPLDSGMDYTWTFGTAWKRCDQAGRKVGAEETKSRKRRISDAHDGAVKRRKPNNQAGPEKVARPMAKSRKRRQDDAHGAAVKRGKQT